MNDNLQPLSDEHLEARITAYVLGEASPFESAEIEALIESSPELKLFANRTRTLHTLLHEAETTSNEASEEWKLHPGKRFKIARALGENPEIPRLPVPGKDDRIRRAAIRAAWGIAAVFVVTFFSLRLLPRDYEAEAIIEIKPRERVIDPLGGQMSQAPTMTPMFFGTEFEKIKSRNSLEKVIDDLNLTARWNTDKETALKRLKDSVETENVPGTDLVAIRVRHPDEHEAKEITRAVTEGYRDYRNSLDKQSTEKGLAELKKAIREQEDKIEERRKILTTISRTKNIIYRGDTKREGLDDDRLAMVEEKRMESKRDALERNIDTQDYIDAKRDFETDLALLEQMKLKAITEEIAADSSDGNIVIHDEAAITGRKFPSRPLAALKKAISGSDKTADASMSELADAKQSQDFGDGTEFGAGWGGGGAPSAPEAPAFAAPEPAPQINIGGQVKAPGPQRFKEGLTLEEAVVRAGGATEFGSTKRVKLHREGEVQTYDIGNENLAQLQLQPGDTIEMPQKNWFGCGASRDEITKSESKNKKMAEAGSSAGEAEVDAIVTSGLRSGDAAITRNSIDAILNNPDRLDNLMPGSESDAFAAKSTPSMSSLPARKADLGAPVDAFADQSGLADADAPDDFGGFANLGAAVVETDPFFDTSGAVAKKDGSKRNTEYEIDTGSASEYLFRGADLGKDKESLPAAEQEAELAAVEDRLRELKAKIEEPSINDSNKQVLFNEWKQLQAESIAKYSRQSAPIDLADLAQEIPAAQEPFSTFSLNISDASFQIAHAAIVKGERPDPGSIKPEQFYNAVDYGDPAPSSLEPVAAAIDQTAHPVIPGRNLVRVAIRTASTGRSAAQPLRLTLLVDQSGSMARADRRAAMDTALAQLATLLTENDRITVIGFSRTPRLIADSLPGNEAAKIPDLVNTTASEGGTNLEQALDLSSELALRHKLDGAQNRIVLFTDGAANLGDADPDRLAGRVKELRQQGLAFDIAGIGTNDTNDRLLSELARHGNGRYYLVGENAGDSFAAQLAGAFRPAAENVKVQVKLNPERVGSYKLIGFEKDRLKTEDFRNDSVDAAELAADEAGVAIYQVETLPEGNGEIGEVSVRFRNTASGEMVERAWTIPHDPYTPALDKADPKTQLATLALLAAQKLQGGPLADAINFRNFSETTARLKQTYANDAKAQRMLNFVNALK